MKKNIPKMIKKYSSSNARKKRWHRAIAILGSVTVFITTYALILPALTMEQTAYCGYEEHKEHTAECYSSVEKLTCNITDEDHEHTESCYETISELVCDKPIHEHTLQCFSDPQADLENSDIWESSLNGVKKTGKYDEDVLAVAKSQLGYKESSRNYLVQQDGVSQNGYTRYGQWYGNPYGKWDSMFSSFCLHYAGVPANIVPVSDNVNGWISAVSGTERYKSDSFEEMLPGDIVFIDSDSDGISDTSAVVESVKDGDVYVIQGDVNGSVARQSYGKQLITAYIDLTIAESDDFEELTLNEGEAAEEPEAAKETNEAEITEVVDADGSHSITATAADGTVAVLQGNIPDGAEAVIVPVPLSGEELTGYIGDRAPASIRQYAAYDISIYVDGIEWQPETPIAVEISNPSMSLAEGDNIEVAHIDSNGVAETVEAEIMPDGDVQFAAGGFSLYIIYTYTVDFHYGNYTYSINGGESILLSELFEVLGIDVDLADVADVEFSDETLIRIDKLGYDDGSSDWRLLSLKAFDTDEELTISLNDNEIISVHVTDAQGDGESSDPLVPVEAPDYIGRYPTGNGSTQWQITKEEYTGRTQSNKIPVDSDGDGKTDVYLQKNVVPTDTENEFLVYLSIDKKMTWESLLDKGKICITTSNKYKNEPIGGIYPSNFQPAGNFTVQLAEHGVQGTYTNRYYIKISVYQNRSSSTPIYTYYDWRYGNTPNCNQGTVFMKLPGLGYLVAATSVNFQYDQAHSSNPFTINMYLDDYQTDLSFYNTDLRSVTDVLGNQMEFMEFVAYDAAETPSYDEQSNTITWLPADNTTVVSEITANPISGWEKNISQLVYRVKLDVKDEDFVSCADTLGNKSASIAAGESFKVNNSAVLTYDKTALPNTSGIPSTYGLTATFPIPEVRGLLYDLSFIKVNEKGRQLANAVFALYQSDGTTPVLDENNQPWILHTRTDEISRIYDLPYGTYVLKEEEAPSHYSTPSQNAWAFRVCNTDSRTLLSADVSPYEHNMRYSANDTNGQWRILNTRKPFHYSVKVIKVDESGAPLADAGFSIVDPENAGKSLSGTTKADGTYLFDAPFDENIAYELSETSAPGGHFSLPAGIQFKVEGNEDTDTYTPVFLNSGDFPGTVDIELKETGTGNNAQYILEVTVQNEGVYELPKAGGHGRFIYTLAGTAFLTVTLMMSFESRRRRERRIAG